MVQKMDLAWVQLPFFPGGALRGGRQKKQIFQLNNQRADCLLEFSVPRSDRFRHDPRLPEEPEPDDAQQPPESAAVREDVCRLLSRRGRF